MSPHWKQRLGKHIPCFAVLTHHPSLGVQPPLHLWNSTLDPWDMSGKATSAAEIVPACHVELQGEEFLRKTRPFISAWGNKKTTRTSTVMTT